MRAMPGVVGTVATTSTPVTSTASGSSFARPRSATGMIPVRPWPADRSVRGATWQGPLVARRAGGLSGPSEARRIECPGVDDRELCLSAGVACGAEPGKDLNWESVGRGGTRRAHVGSGSGVASSVRTMVRPINPSTAAIVLGPSPPRTRMLRSPVQSLVQWTVQSGLSRHWPLHHAVARRRERGEMAVPPLLDLAGNLLAVRWASRRSSDCI